MYIDSFQNTGHVMTESEKQFFMEEDSEAEEELRNNIALSMDEPNELKNLVVHN